MLTNGLCTPHCLAGDHGECSDGDCLCPMPECQSYRDEWYEGFAGNTSVEREEE